MATTSTLPRPGHSRPSYGPPTGPLPSLPIPRTRKSSVSSATSANSRRGSGNSFVPTPSTARTVSTSSLPTLKPPKKQHKPNASGNTTAPTTPHGERVLSIGAFPQPPKSGPRISAPTSPLATESPAEEMQKLPVAKKQRNSTGARTAPPRTSSIAKTRTSSRAASLKIPNTNSPSLLDGTGDRKSVSSTLLAPSPDSRNSSALGSYTTSATTIEDLGEDERGRDTTPVDGTGDKRSSVKDGKDKGNVIVSVRVRPDAGKSERDKSDLEWMVDGRRSLISYRGREGGEYYYDNVFTTHDNNPKVYDAAAKRLVRRVMEGYHGTVFAYGMTGTGKTFSMQGTATNPGVIPLAITDIFSFIRETPHREFLLRVSYLEIYNEKIHDLLAINSTGINGLQAPLEEIKLREDSKRGVYATPLKEEIVQSPTQLLRVIARGDNARRTAGTQWNARSSRSHAVVQIVVESRERQPGNASMAESKRQALLPGGVRVSTLSLIDLAGSEKAADTAERRKEGSHINKSLLTLGTVIANLSGDKEKPGAKDGKHLPYRDSKLTRLLQPALSGNSLVSILCTIQIGSAGSVATAQAHTGETLNTMKFASRAKNNIVSHAKKAEEAFGGSGAAAALLDRYRLEIADLRKQLDEVKGENAHGTPAKWSSSKSELKEEKDEEKEEEPLSIEAEKERDKARELEQEQRHEEQMLEMQLARTALKERIEHLNRLILSSKSVGVNYSANRSYSSLSLQRTSVASNGENYSTSRSQRSSAATLEAAKSPTGSSMGLNRNGSAASMRSLRGIRDSSMTTSTTGHHIPETGSEEDVDTFDENGDGQASLNVQVRALQSDLADKNRYIGTLEKRLLQARRSSSSRVSMGFSARHTRDLSADGEGGGVEQVLKEKDAEIAELRARLDDKDRMVTALRSAARKRDVADLAVDTGVNGEGINGLSRGSSGRSPIGRSPSSQSQNATSPHPGMSRVASGGSSHSFGLSPVARDRGDREGGPNHKSVDSVTKMLDEMIKQRVRGEAESHSHSNSPHAQRNSHEKIVEESESAAEEQATTGARKPSTSSEKDRIDSGIGVKSPTTKTSRRSSSVRVVSP